MGIVRAFRRLLGLLCVAVAALLGLFALVGYFTDDTGGSRTLAAVIGALAVLLLIIGLRCFRGRKRVTQAAPRHQATLDVRAMEDAHAEWQDPAIIEDDNAPWRPWMRKGRLYRAIREGRYIRVAYQKKAGEEATTRILWPRKIAKGRLRADDLTPGKTPGSKLFIVDRITYVELLPPEWTPMELGR